MNSTAITLVILVVVVSTVLAFLFRKKVPIKRLNKTRFTTKWRELQSLCAHKDTWPLAIINADKLLDEALKRRHFKGKGMGERLVSAQRYFTNNDSVWAAHKLRNRLVHEDSPKIKEKDVKEALISFRQALKDLGAL